MKNLCLIFSAAFAILVPARADTVTRWNGTSRIEFAGTSTLHDWSGTVNAEPFTAVVVIGEDNQPKSLGAEVKVKAAGMNTGEAKRDDNMHKDMKVDAFPFISGKMDAGFDKIMSGGVPAKLPFILSIMGRPHEVLATVKNWSLKGGTATFDIEFSLSLKKCGINVPSVLLVISVGDTIKLHAPVKLVRADS